MTRIFPDSSESAKKQLIQKNPYNIRQIENPSIDLQITSLYATNGVSIGDIKNAHMDALLYSIELDPRNLHFIDEQPEEVQLAAIKRGAQFYKYVRNPTENVNQLYILKSL